MTRVSVVCTEHEPDGPVNAAGLLAILERIQPEVIFLECPPAALESYLDGAESAKLEPAAITLYRESHPGIEVIPVDLPTPSGAFFGDYFDLIRQVARWDSAYDRYAGWHRQYIATYGFAYLNSVQCNELFAKQDAVIVTAIPNLVDHQKLAESYEAWTTFKKAREMAWVTNIESHCRGSSFSRAAFPVGAAHRQSLVELSGGEQGVTPSTIQWDFDSFLVPHPTAEARTGA